MDVTIFLILTAFCWGVSPIFDKIALRQVDALTAVTFRSMVVTVFLLAATFLYKRQGVLFSINFKSMAALTLSAVFAGLLGMLTYYAALKLGATSRIVPLAATYPLVTVFLSIFLLGENVNFTRFAGTILIIAGIWLVK